jgi:hypothetical protein
MVTVRLTKRRQRGLACHELKIGSGVDQPSVEEHPAVERGGRRSVGKCCKKGARSGAVRLLAGSYEYGVPSFRT